MLVYEDTPTGLRAKRSLDLLPLSLPACKTRLWRWDLFENPWLREYAAKEASRADIILLSAHGRDELPPGLREWLNRWLTIKEDRPYALGLLLDGNAAWEPERERVVQFVRRLAAAAGVDFFNSSEKPGAGAESPRVPFEFCFNGETELND
jgi:hypothetical protein